MSSQAWLLFLVHRLLSRKFWQDTVPIARDKRFSRRLFFSYFAKMSINVLVELRMAPYFDLSHILLLRCDARWRQAVYPPFPGNKTDGENGCRLKIGTVTSLKKILYFGSCKWVAPCRNGLGTVPKIWLACELETAIRPGAKDGCFSRLKFGVRCQFFSACKWGFS